ncbi:aminotransferase-like domain-containing protein [Rhizobium paknamense]|uniref:DNA-binding transcriptional MocR family regulator n=1 Tax=Rhizobium paknamense TaxID=1206817 RepID=A0ABU0IE17_9HYPH|nr:PLP-dependent aminotransferase family protein [Rhizobium paknamense]MDQ0455481.1 DNA-binding transcriptional MocR family regulator [Rhizobium paknamense]
MLDTPFSPNRSRLAAVVTAIRDRLAARQLAAGDRLPSIRKLAEDMGVSPSTVVEAYDRLVAEGLIRARKGSGFYVADQLPPPLKLAESEAERPRSIDPFWVSRQSLDSAPGSSRPGCGWLPPDWMPNAALAAGLKAASRRVEALTAYGTSRGSAALRKLLASRLYDQGLPVQEEQLILTGSGTQSLDLICRLLLRPGDGVIVDDPSYFNFQTSLKAHQVRIIPVPMTPQGPDIEAFETAVNREKPRLYLTNSALHNPTGATLSPQIAFRLLSIVTRAEMLVIEDDIFTDFEPDPSLTYPRLDGLERVIRIGSFSKTLSASLRCGYIATRPDWIKALTDLQIACHFGGPSPLITDMVQHVLSGGAYRRHLDQLRSRLAASRSQVAERLAGLGVTPWLMPRGGFYLWCRLPEGIGSSDVAQRALQAGVIFAPGNVFSPSLTAETFMRFNVAHMDDARPWRALEAALAAGRGN